jgi:hypothetical protein
LGNKGAAKTTVLAKVTTNAKIENGQTRVERVPSTKRRADVANAAKAENARTLIEENVLVRFMADLREPPPGRQQGREFFRRREHANQRVATKTVDTDEQNVCMVPLRGPLHPEPAGTELQRKVSANCGAKRP